MKARIAIVNNDSSSLVRFSNFSEDFRQRHCRVPLRIDSPTMLKWNSHHMTTFAEETGYHLLRNNFLTDNFRSIGLGLKGQQGLLFCFVLKRTDLCFVTFDDLINAFSSTAIIFFQHFYAPIDMSLCLSVCQILRNPTRTDPFYGHVFMQY